MRADRVYRSRFLPCYCLRFGRRTAHKVAIYGCQHQVVSIDPWGLAASA